MIKDHCVENSIIDEAEEKPTEETAEVLNLKLEYEHEEWRLAHEEAHEEAQRAREAAEAEAQRAREAEKVLQDAQFAEAQKTCKRSSRITTG